YYMSTDTINNTYLQEIKFNSLPVKSKEFLTGDAGCWKYLVYYQYFISAKTLPQVIYEYKGTVSYKYVGYDTPTLTATLTADPTSVKYVGDDIEVDLILEGEVHNIEDPGVLKE